MFDDVILRSVGHRNADVALVKPLCKPVDHHRDDGIHVLFAQRTEDDHVVDTVDELGAHRLFERLHLPLLHVVVIGLGVARTEAQLCLCLDLVRADVGRHDDDGVLEVDRPAVRIGQSAVVEDLEQDVEHVGVSLFDLVEQHDGIGLAAHLFGQLSALVVTDVTGRGTYQFGHADLVHVLGHIQTYQHVLIAEHRLGERLGKLRLADACRSEEDERAYRTLGILHAGSRPSDRLGDRRHRLVLTDDALVQRLFEVKQSLRLALGQFDDGDLCPCGHDRRDVVHAHFEFDVVVMFVPRLLLLVDAFLKFFRLFLDCLRLIVQFVLGKAHLLHFEAVDLVLHLLDVVGHHEVADPLLGRRLVDQVDRLVGQEPVADVPVGHLCRRLERLVGDSHMVMLFVLGTYAFEDRDRVLDRGRIDNDLLESALERTVLFDELAILVERGRADRLHLPSRQHGFEDVGGVDAVFGRAARADDHVDLVDEHDDVASRQDRVDRLFEPLFKVAPVLGARQHRGDVEREHRLAAQHLGHVAVDDRLGKPLDDRALADAGFADQHRVVLGAAAKDLDDPLDLFAAPDDGVEHALPCLLGQVFAKILKLFGQLGVDVGFFGARVVLGHVRIVRHDVEPFVFVTDLVIVAAVFFMLTEHRLSHQTRPQFVHVDAHRRKRAAGVRTAVFEQACEQRDRIDRADAVHLAVHLARTQRPVDARRDPDLGCRLVLLRQKRRDQRVDVDQSCQDLSALALRTRYAGEQVFGPQKTAFAHRVSLSLFDRSRTFFGKFHIISSFNSKSCLSMRRALCRALPR